MQREVFIFATRNTSFHSLQIIRLSKKIYIIYKEHGLHQWWVERIKHQKSQARIDDDVGPKAKKSQSGINVNRGRGSRKTFLVLVPWSQASHLNKRIANQIGDEHKLKHHFHFIFTVSFNVAKSFGWCCSIHTCKYNMMFMTMWWVMSHWDRNKYQFANQYISWILGIMDISNCWNTHFEL